MHLINGIRRHRFVDHAMVVLVPLATLGTIATAVRPWWRRPYDPLVLAAALIAAGVQVYRVGDSGARAASGDAAQSSTGG